MDGAVGISPAGYLVLVWLQIEVSVTRRRSALAQLFQLPPVPSPWSVQEERK